jgi:hypothetical protein
MSLNDDRNPLLRNADAEDESGGDLTDLRLSTIDIHTTAYV